MRDWNVLITTVEGHYRQALRLLESWGEVQGTAFFNVIVMKANHPMALLEQLHKIQLSAAEEDFIFSRVIPDRQERCRYTFLKTD
jgi:hypothetical protein